MVGRWEVLRRWAWCTTVGRRLARVPWGDPAALTGATMWVKPGYFCPVCMPVWVVRFPIYSLRGPLARLFVLLFVDMVVAIQLSKFAVSMRRSVRMAVYD